MEPSLNWINDTLFSFLLMIGLLLLSAFFSGAETALFSLSPDAVRRLGGRRRTDELMAVLRDDPAGLLTAILFGNLIVNILFFCTGAALAGQWGAAYGDWAEATGGILILFGLILFGELAPKAAGVTHGADLLKFTAPPLRIWFIVVKPFRVMIRLFLERFGLEARHAEGRDYLTPGEFRELLDAVRHEPGFGSSEKEMLEDIVNLSAMRVREIMVPRVNVLRRPLDTPCDDLLAEAREKEFSRILIYRDSDEDAAGYVRIKDLFAAEQPVKSLKPFLHPLVFVPETQRADTLLRRFTRSDLELAAVVDEYGGLAGIVTVDDLLSEVVGDFEPEPLEEIEPLDETSYRLNGRLPIREWRELFTGFLPEKEVGHLAFDTIGGLVISLLGRMPKAGDRVFLRNLSLTVETMHQRHIGTVLLRLETPTEEAS